MPADGGFPENPLEFDFVDFGVFLVRQQIEAQKACVVAGERIFFARVAQSDDQKVGCADGELVLFYKHHLLNYVLHIVLNHMLTLLKFQIYLVLHF